MATDSRGKAEQAGDSASLEALARVGLTNILFHQLPEVCLHDVGHFK